MSYDTSPRVIAARAQCSALTESEASEEQERRQPFGCRGAYGKYVAPHLRHTQWTTHTAKHTPHTQAASADVTTETIAICATHVMPKMKPATPTMEAPVTLRVSGQCIAGGRTDCVKTTGPTKYQKAGMSPATRQRERKREREREREEREKEVCGCV